MAQWIKHPAGLHWWLRFDTQPRYQVADTQQLPHAAGVAEKEKKKNSSLLFLDL